MITCVSSVFDWENHSDEWKRNILIARNTWHNRGFGAIYVSKPITELNKAGTKFTGDNDFAPVWRLLEVASQQKGLVILLDADLRIGPRISNAIEALNSGDVDMVTSRRWTISSRESVGVVVTDFAVDFYMGRPDLFEEPSKLMPRGCRVAHNLWDSWLVGYFNKTLGDRFKSLTQHRFLYHPIHSERNAPYGDDHFKEDEYSKHAGHPAEV